jgi:signal transduction histidine kinase
MIQINARQDGENIYVEVLDNGPGINDVNLSQVLDPFFTTKPEGDGTGLGLSVSYGIVKEHGGDIQLENRTEGGVRVLIQLPVDAEAQHDLERDLTQELEEEQPRVEVANAN